MPLNIDLFTGTIPLPLKYSQKNTYALVRVKTSPGCLSKTCSTNTLATLSCTSTPFSLACLDSGLKKVWSAARMDLARWTMERMVLSFLNSRNRFSLCTFSGDFFCASHQVSTQQIPQLFFTGGFIQLVPAIIEIPLHLALQINDMVTQVYITP